MSFRRVKNEKDKRQAYCRKQASLVEATGLPGEVFRVEESLQELLRCGTFQTTAEAWRLAAMSDSAFAALERFIEPVFDFQHSYPALSNERFRRFKRYG